MSSKGLPQVFHAPQIVLIVYESCNSSLCMAQHRDAIGPLFRDLVSVRAYDGDEILLWLQLHANEEFDVIQLHAAAPIAQDSTT